MTAPQDIASSEDSNEFSIGCDALFGVCSECGKNGELVSRFDEGQACSVECHRKIRLRQRKRMNAPKNSRVTGFPGWHRK